jgi:hypothetical protein
MLIQLRVDVQQRLLEPAMHGWQPRRFEGISRQHSSRGLIQKADIC